MRHLLLPTEQELEDGEPGVGLELAVGGAVVVEAPVEHVGEDDGVGVAVVDRVGPPEDAGTPSGGRGAG